MLVHTIGGIRRFDNTARSVSTLKNALRVEEPDAVVSAAMRYVYSSRVNIVTSAECFELTRGTSNGQAHMDRSNGGVKTIYSIAVGRLIEDPNIEATLITSRTSTEGLYVRNLGKDPVLPIDANILMRFGGRNIGYIKRIGLHKIKPLLHEESITELLGDRNPMVCVIGPDEANLRARVLGRDSEKIDPRLNDALLHMLGEINRIAFLTSELTNEHRQ